MALWINGGQVKAVEKDGVTLQVRVLPAREMVNFLRETESIEADFGGESLETFIGLCERGLMGWSGDGAPEYSREALEKLSLAALQDILKAIIETNTLSDIDRGNSHAS